MAGDASAQREKQDQSIKARKNELFVGEQAQETGPRKKLRDYLKETPAAPLSKNVKLSLWGSAVPVGLLFAIALYHGGNRSVAKAPTEMVIPARAQPAPPSLVSRTDDKPPAPALDPKSGDHKDKDKAEAKSDKPGEDKAKATTKKGGKKPKKPKNTVVVQNTEDDKAKGDERNDKADDKDKPSGDSKKKPNTASSDPGSKGKMAAGKDDKGKPAPPRKQAPSILVKKKKAYNPAYPPKTPVGEKKADSDSDPGIP